MRDGARVRVLVWLACAVVGVASAAEAQPFVAGELVVKLKPHADSRALDAVLAKHRAKRLRRLFPQLEDARGSLRASASQRAGALRQRFAARARRGGGAHVPPRLETFYVLQLDGAADLHAAAAELATLPDVEYAEPNWIYQNQATPLPALPLVPDDRFVTQDGVHWSEGAWGQNFLDLWGIEKSRAIGAWNAFDADDSGAFEPGETRPGEGVVVAVIDSGVDRLHPDIAANIWTNPGEIPSNGLDDEGNGFVDDVHGWNFANNTNDTIDLQGHGTHVAGTVAAAAQNGAGVVGVAPWARIMPVAGLNANGSGTATGLANAVIYAAENGADILSNSWGGPSAAVVADAFAFAASVGVVSVAAAGNSSFDVEGVTPASLPDVIAVAALGPDDRKASFSNFGRGIDISAPGTGVLSLNAGGGNNTLARERPERVVETDYLWLHGTSMACPHVSGALAVLMSRFPGDSADELHGRLRAGARDVDALDPVYAGRLGAGALDLQASLEASPTPLFALVDTSPRDLPPGGGPLDLVVHLQNFWAETDFLAAYLTSSDPNVVIHDGFASFGAVPTDETRTNESDPFKLTLAPDIPNGSTVEFTLSVWATGYAATFPLQLRVTFFADETGGSGLPTYEFLTFDVVFEDYNGDRLPDISMLGFFSYRFLKNLGGGRFADAVPETGVVPGLGASEALFFDADNDGDRDALIGGSQSRYFENPGSNPFLDRSVESGVSNKALGSAIVADYDRDGWLDVLGGQARLALLRNGSDGTFTDLAAASGFATSPADLRLTRAMLAFDYDDDGDPDVAGVTLAGGIFLLGNRGDGTFADALPSSGIDNSRRGGWALASGDYDNDGDLDLFVTGIGATFDVDRNVLYRNDGNGRFTNVTAQSGELLLGFGSGWSAPAFFDFDNDGDLDLFLDSEGAPNEVHYHVLYRNDGRGDFKIVNDVAFPSGFAPGSGAGGIADYDRDGSLDLFVPDGNFGGNGRGGLLRNLIGAENHFVRIDLTGWPREPYGARVRVHTGGGAWQTREVHTSGVEALPLHFGLGSATAIERVEIRWPDGRLQRIADVAVDQEVAFVEQGVFCSGDGDADADGVLDGCDNCPSVANADQADADADGAGDACNDAADADGDEWSDALDVCPGAFDPDQADANGDGIGEACVAEVPALPLGAWLAILAGVALTAARALRAARRRA